MKKIYISHSKDFDYKNDLYAPLKELKFDIEFIFPHEDSDEPYNLKELFLNKQCDMVLAEVSLPSTGQGIELGWADSYGIPILCCHKEGSKISKSVLTVAKNSFTYTNNVDLINKVTEKLGENYA